MRPTMTEDWYSGKLPRLPNDPDFYLEQYADLLSEEQKSELHLKLIMSRTHERIYGQDKPPYPYVDLRAHMLERIKRAVEFEPDKRPSMCISCGSLVISQAVHTKWHDAVKLETQWRENQVLPFAQFTTDEEQALYAMLGWS